VMAIVGMMIIPLPTPLLDILLVLNISISMVMLLIAMYIPDALKLAAFPTIMLITTMYRLALNVDHPLILLDGDAGEVVYVVRQLRGARQLRRRRHHLRHADRGELHRHRQGLGARRRGRRALHPRRHARQADVDRRRPARRLHRHGRGKRKRRDLERESQLFGSMDGAMKFVKGDAIAGIIITVVNIVGGLAIGVMQKGMTVGDAAKKYALLTIGDGLVGMIPAILISTAPASSSRASPGEEEGATSAMDVGHAADWRTLAPSPSRGPCSSA
jgi:type III secretion protein V